MNNKQSSVEWLIAELGEYFPHEIGGIELMVSKAKEMHKEEMFEYIKQKYCIGHRSLEFHRLEFDNYYNETFGGNNEQ